MKRSCFLLTEGTSLLPHKCIELILKAIQTIQHAVDVAMNLNLGDVLLGVLFPGLAQQNLNALVLVVNRINPHHRNCDA